MWEKSGSCGHWLWQVDGKTSVAPAGNKSLRLSQASNVKYDYLPTYLPTYPFFENVLYVDFAVLDILYIDVLFLKQPLLLPLLCYKSANHLSDRLKPGPKF